MNMKDQFEVKETDDLSLIQTTMASGHVHNADDDKKIIDMTIGELRKELDTMYHPPYHPPHNSSSGVGGAIIFVIVVIAAFLIFVI